MIALKIALSFTNKNTVTITPGCIQASCQGVVIAVTQEHNIPPGQYTYRGCSLQPCEGVPAQDPLVQGPNVKYLGQIPSAPAWRVRVSFAELTGQVFNTRCLRTLSILSVLHKGQLVTVAQDQEIIFFTLQNIIISVTSPVPITKVLVVGLPVRQHYALKELALTRGISVNKIILTAIEKAVTL